jgi:hypothetical protein
MFFILSLLLTVSAFSQDLPSISRKPKWHKLLHYKNSKSEADSPSFFLHEDGKTNPLKELEKSVKVFASTQRPDNDHPICKFPLRYKWLNAELGNPWKADFSGCTTYISFFSKLAARRASIVFSSYYMGNPSTVFGHTLLRLSRYDDKQETEMLDYGINYSAQARETNPIIYAYKGLMGGYEGKFAALPYYYKIREYSNAEFRDLWSYDLKLTMPQVLEMVDHIWELGNTQFDYFYFHENCSYHLLGIIDVAVPEAKLTDEFNYFTIPADTIRLLQRKGLLEAGKRRESTYSKLLRTSGDLSQESLKLSKEVALHPEKVATSLQGKSDQESADILDVSLEAFDYFHSQKILSDDPATKAQKENILRARAVNPVITQEKAVESLAKDSPAFSHAPSRLGLYSGYEDKRGKEFRFELRTSFHELLDPPRGALKQGQLELGKGSVTLSENRYGDAKFVFEHFSVLSIKNYPGQNFWSSPLSWEVEAGATRMRRSTCFDCPQGYVFGSIGNALELQQGKVLLALLMNGEFNLQNDYRYGYRVGLGPKFFARVIFSEKWLTSLTGTYHLNSYSGNAFFKDQQLLADWDLRYHFHKDFSLASKVSGFEYQSKWIPRGELGLQYFY